MVVLGGGMVVFFGGVGWLVYEDDAPPEDGHLRWERTPLADGENGLVVVAGIEWDLPGDYGKRRIKVTSYRTDWDAAWVEDLRVRNEEKWRQFQEAVGQEWRWNDSFGNSAMHVVIGSLGLKRIELLQKLKEDDWGRALGVVEEMLRVVEKVHRCDGEQIAQIVAMVHGNMAFWLLNSALDRPGFPTALLDEAEKLAQRGEVDRTLVARCVCAEYHHALEVFNIGVRNGFEIPMDEAPIVVQWGNLSLFKPNRTRRILCSLYTEKLEGIVSVSIPAKKLIHERVEAYRSDYINSWMSTNAYGHYVVGLTADTWFPSEQILRAEIVRMLTQVRVALMRFHDDRGVWPEDLGELVPDFLLELPKDPYGAGPFRYRPEIGAVYSVWENGVDDGGPEIGDKLDHFMPRGDFGLWFRGKPVMDGSGKVVRFESLWVEPGEGR